MGPAFIEIQKSYLEWLLAPISSDVVLTTEIYERILDLPKGARILDLSEYRGPHGVKYVGFLIESPVFPVYENNKEVSSLFMEYDYRYVGPRIRGTTLTLEKTTEFKSWRWEPATETNESA